MDVMGAPRQTGEPRAPRASRSRNGYWIAPGLPWRLRLRQGVGPRGARGSARFGWCAAGRVCRGFELHVLGRHDRSVHTVVSGRIWTGGAFTMRRRIPGGACGGGYGGPYRRPAAGIFRVCGPRAAPPPAAIAARQCARRAAPQGARTHRIWPGRRHTRHSPVRAPKACRTPAGGPGRPAPAMAVPAPQGLARPAAPATPGLCPRPARCRPARRGRVPRAGPGAAHLWNANRPRPADSVDVAACRPAAAGGPAAGRPVISYGGGARGMAVARPARDRAAPAAGTGSGTIRPGPDGRPPARRPHGARRRAACPDAPAGRRGPAGTRQSRPPRVPHGMPAGAPHGTGAEGPVPRPGIRRTPAYAVPHPARGASRRHARSPARPPGGRAGAAPALPRVRAPPGRPARGRRARRPGAPPCGAAGGAGSGHTGQTWRMRRDAAGGGGLYATGGDLNACHTTHERRLSQRLWYVPRIASMTGLSHLPTCPISAWMSKDRGIASTDTSEPTMMPRTAGWEGAIGRIAAYGGLY